VSGKCAILQSFSLKNDKRVNWLHSQSVLKVLKIVQTAHRNDKKNFIYALNPGANTRWIII